MKTPSSIYQQKLQQQSFLADPGQLVVLKHFDRLAEALNAKHGRSTGFLSYFENTAATRGVYLWGEVGIGKTVLMDCFFEALVTEKKRRVHFHAFMLELHEKLTQYPSKKDPIKLVAKSIADDVGVLCFDEFFVKDITNAMLLARIMGYLFEYNVTLVATSNAPPDDLYLNGLQRQNFMPTISLIKKHCETMHLSTTHDYRQRFFTNAGVFYTPINSGNELKISAAFDVVAKGDVSSDPIAIHHRLIAVIKKSDNAIWCSFSSLCHVPRSQHDYLALVAQYDYVFISDVVAIEEHQRDIAVNFIHLIDVLYDAGVKLVMLSEVPLALLYEKGRFEFEFKRTLSRLQEMQSSAYFSS